MIASVAIAVVSATVAIAMVLRTDDASAEWIAMPAQQRGERAESASEAASEAELDSASDAELDSASDSAVDPERTDASARSPVLPSDPALGWPDTQLRALPPAGTAPAAMGQSVGSPRDGALLRATRLPDDDAYSILDPKTAFGTDNTIERLRTAIARVREQHPGLPPLVIGDISTRRGGPLAGHQSHQAGRDVDVGLVHRTRPADAPGGFLEGTRENLDREATYALVAALAASAGEPGGVSLIVLDYNLQRILRRAAEVRGATQAELDALFQFPRGPNAREGLVRHMPAHRDHIHVRFACPEREPYCRDPLIGFGGMEAAEGRGPSGI